MARRGESMGALSLARRVEPGAMRSGDPAAKIGDRGDQGRPGLGRAVLVGAIVAARMEAQRVACSHGDDATTAQVGFRKRARDRPGHGIETARRLGRTTRRGKAILPWDWVRRQGKERARLLEGIAQPVETAAERDEVEKVAMLAGGGVGPLAGGALAMVRSAQADKQAAAAGVGDIADQPVAALPMAVGEIVTAHRLGVAREAAGQVRGVRRHGCLLTPPGRRPGRSGSVPSVQRGSRDRRRRSARTDGASR